MTYVVTVLSVKGGVGKTVTAIHLAAFFQQFGPTLLVDGDATRSATLWSKPGKLPFKVVPERQIGLELSQRRYEYMVVDTEANPPDEDFRELVNSCHLVVVPRYARRFRSPVRNADRGGSFGARMRKPG